MISQKICPASFLEYLANIWTLRLFGRCCDITKFGLAFEGADILQISAIRGKCGSARLIQGF